MIQKDDLFFFKFLFSEKAGYNLRNDIAHSLLPIEGYNLHVIQLMIIALIRFGKYQIKE